MPHAAAFFPFIAASLILPMIAFAIVRLCWFFSCRVGKSLGIRVFLLSAGIFLAIVLDLALLKSIDWSGIPGWLRVLGGLGLLVVLYMAAMAFVATIYVREISIRLSANGPSTWLTGLAIGILAFATLVTIRVGIPTFDGTPLLVTGVDMLQLRSIDMMSVVVLVLACLCYTEGTRLSALPANDGIALGWRIGLATAMLSIFSKVVGQKVPFGKDVLWFTEERSNISALSPYTAERFQETLIAFWQSDAIAVLVLLMIGALLLLPALLSFSAAPAWRRSSVAFVAAAWLVSSSVFALNYPSGEFNLMPAANHGFILVAGLVVGAALGVCVHRLIDNLHQWRTLANAPYIVKLITPPWLILAALALLLFGVFLALPDPAVSADALAVGMALRFGVIAFAAIWSIRHCARIYRGNIVDELVAAVQPPELETHRP